MESTALTLNFPETGRAFRVKNCDPAMFGTTGKRSTMLAKYANRGPDHHAKKSTEETLKEHASDLRRRVSGHILLKRRSQGPSEGKG